MSCRCVPPGMYRSTKMAIGSKVIGRSRRGGDRRRNRRCICACDRVEILPMPELEDNEAPEPLRVIAAARQVFTNEAIDEPAIEISAFLRGARQQHI